MRRRLFTILSALSLLACAASSVVWIKSYEGKQLYPLKIERQWAGQFRFGWRIAKRSTTLQIYWPSPPTIGPVKVLKELEKNGNGSAYLGFPSNPEVDTWEKQWRDFTASSEHKTFAVIRHPRFIDSCDGVTLRPASGFPPYTVEIPRRVFVGRFYQVDFPLWSAIVATAALPLVWAACLARRLARRPPNGRCRRCGYDLRATPGRCPECGMVPKMKSATAKESLIST